VFCSGERGHQKLTCRLGVGRHGSAGLGKIAKFEPAGRGLAHRKIAIARGVRRESMPIWTAFRHEPQLDGRFLVSRPLIARQARCPIHGNAELPLRSKPVSSSSFGHIEIVGSLTGFDLPPTSWLGERPKLTRSRLKSRNNSFALRIWRVHGRRKCANLRHLGPVSRILGDQTLHLRNFARRGGRSHASSFIDGLRRPCAAPDPSLCG
jgi:hypothetical protein